MGLSKVINEELKALFENLEVYTIHDLAQMLMRLPEMHNSTVDVIEGILKKEYQKGGDAAVINLYQQYAGVEIEALRNGRYVFNNLTGGGNTYSYGDAGNRNSYIGESKVLDEIINLLEGTGDRYAQKFGIPNAGEDFEQQWQKQQKATAADSVNGKLVGIVKDRESGRGINIYMNPRSLQNFEKGVRAISDNQGNVYIAQLDEYFIHEDIGMALGFHNINDPNLFITWERFMNTNRFNFSYNYTKMFDELMAKDSNRLLTRIEVLNQKQPFDFVVVPHEMEEGVGDRYAEKKWGIPDADKQYQNMGVKGNNMGELIGYISSGNGGNGDPDPKQPIYKNPSSLNGFGSDVRAVSDSSGNLYVALNNGDFVHVAFCKALGMSTGAGVYDVENALTWQRLGDSNKFGLANSSSTYPVSRIERTRQIFADKFEAVTRANPQYEFADKDYYSLKWVDEVISEEIKAFEGVGDRYAEKKWGIPNQDTSYQSQTQPAMQGDENGELVGYALDTSYDRSEPDTRNPIFKNPRSLKNFEAGVRAVSDSHGDLWVGQTNGDYYHGSMKAAIKVIPDVYFWKNAITWTREGNTNKFGLSESSNGWGGIRDRAFQQVFQANLAAVKRKHPEFEFVVNFTADLIEGVGDRYAEKQAGIPNAGDEFEKRWQTHRKTQERDVENGSLVGQVFSTEDYDDYTKHPINVYKNPKSLKNFEPNVRAVGDHDGNLYVAQIDGNFYHENIIDIVPSISSYSEGVQLYRAGDTNWFGVAGTYIRNVFKTDDVTSAMSKEHIEDHPEIQKTFVGLNNNLPQYKFSYYPTYMLRGQLSQQQMDQSVLTTPKPGSGDKMAYFEEGAAYGDDSGYMQMGIKEELLDEGLSDIVYHYTYTGNVPNILATDKFNTSSNIGTKADADKDRGRRFYFSTQRTKGKSGYAKSNGGDAALVLDGRKLMQRYKGAPVDYWNWSKSRKDWGDQQHYMQALQSNELEDRIFTDEPYIENASQYIKEIHIDLSRPWYLKKSKARDIEGFAKHVGIPVYFYDDKNQYQLQNKAKSKPLEDINTGFRDESEEDSDRGDNHFYWMFKELAPYIFYNTKHENEFWQLFKKFLDSKDKEQEFDKYKQEIDERTKQVADFYRKENNRYWYYIRDKFTSISSDFHNKKGSKDPYYREFLRLFVRDMNDFKAHDLIAYFVNKLDLKKDENGNVVNEIIREEIIKEIGEANVEPYHWDKETTPINKAQYQFVAKQGSVPAEQGQLYEVYFQQGVNFNDPKAWYSGFQAHGYGDEQTTDGNELQKIMATIVDIVKAFVKEYGPETLVFEPSKASEKDNRRLHLYMAYIRKNLTQDYQADIEPNATGSLQIVIKKNLTQDSLMESLAEEIQNYIKDI